jgi:DNA polymerase
MSRARSKTAGAAPFVPERGGLAALAEAVQHCRGCDLYRHATQAVFGAGPVHARVMLVGEQPGDQEDRRGAPFVGPAGRILDRALEQAGIDRATVFVTNAVKHFKFVEKGKRRIHQKPTFGEISACRPWLEAELALVQPEVLVAMGATAARAVFGPSFKLLQQRGRAIPTPLAAKTIATIHPSAILRGDDEAAQAAMYEMFVDDLTVAARALAGEAA